MQKLEGQGGNVALADFGVLFHFDTLPDCGRRTDVRTDISTSARTALCNAPCGNICDLFCNNFPFFVDGRSDVCCLLRLGLLAVTGSSPLVKHQQNVRL